MVIDFTKEDTKKNKKELEMTKRILEYLDFKKLCVDAGIFNINEIIKLFEVWIKNA